MQEDISNRPLCKCHDENEGREERTGGIAPHILRTVTDYIQENLAEELPLNTLAKVAGLSRYRFSHNFKQATGFPPHQFIVRERIERAKTILRETDLTIISIAFAVGFDSPSRFTQIFRRLTGVTPSAYRAALTSRD